jgi:hypothetical protein
LKRVQTDATVNFNWGTGAPGAGLCSDRFSARWSGYVNTPAAGIWTFYVESDDGMRLDLETSPGVWTRVVEDWSDHGARERAGTASLSAGWHGIRVEYYEATGSASARLRYAGPGVARQIIPSSALRSCTSPCSVTPPTNLTVTVISDLAAQLNWVAGSGGTVQYLYLDDSQADVAAGCPAGAGTGAGQCLIKNTSVGAGVYSYSTGEILGPTARYYFRVVTATDATCQAPSGIATFLTAPNNWFHADGGEIYANHLISGRAAPAGQFNSRWGIFARGEIARISSQEGWKAQFYPNRSFNLTENTPFRRGLTPAGAVPDYATLLKRFGAGAQGYSGASLPTSSGVFLISGSHAVTSIATYPAGGRTLVFVAGDLTVGAEIRVPADSVVAFIAAGKIQFAKSLTGGTPAVDRVGGLFLAQGQIVTAYDRLTPQETTPQLLVEGALISLADNLLLTRNLPDLANDATPADTISLPARYLTAGKTILGRPKFFYREVPAGTSGR